MSHQLHPNSVAAYEAWADAHESLRASLIIRAFLKHGPMTDREVFQDVFGKDSNWARPAITRLKHAGCLVELCDKTCTTTGHVVRVSYLADDPSGLGRLYVTKRAPGVWEGIPLPCRVQAEGDQVYIVGLDSIKYLAVGGYNREALAKALVAKINRRKVPKSC